MNKNLRLAVAGVAVAALAAVGAGTTAYAHHAFAAEFDADAPVLLKGAVVVTEWVNPHTCIHIKVPNVDGKGQAKQGTTFNWAIEGGKPASFRVTRAGGFLPLTIPFTVGGTATAGTDYTLSASGSISLPAGATSATVTVTAPSDAEMEDAETIVVTLQAGSGYTLGSGVSATATIVSQGIVGEYFNNAGGSYVALPNVDPVNFTGLAFTRRDATTLSDTEKEAYKKGLKAEAEERRRLRKEAWQAYKANHIVHLGEGEGVFWTDATEPDYVPPAAVLQVPPTQGGIEVLTPTLVDRAHRLDLKVHAWTINDEAEMRELIDLGIDGIITDYPARLRDL